MLAQYHGEFWFVRVNQVARFRLYIRLLWKYGAGKLSAESV